MEPESADGRRVLISSAMGNKCFVCNVQSELSFHTSFAHVKRVFTRLRLRLESDVLNDRSVAHFSGIRKHLTLASVSFQCPPRDFGGRASFTCNVRPSKLSPSS